MILWKWKVQRRNLCNKKQQFWICYYKSTKFLFLGKAVLVCFQQNANKVVLILKSVYIETLAENLTL